MHLEISLQLVLINQHGNKCYKVSLFKGWRKRDGNAALQKIIKWRLTNKSRSNVDKGKVKEGWIINKENLAQQSNLQWELFK